MQLGTSLTHTKKGGGTHLPSCFHHSPSHSIGRHTHRVRKHWEEPWSMSHSTFCVCVPTLVQAASWRALQASWSSSPVLHSVMSQKAWLRSSSFPTSPNSAGQTSPCWHSQHVSLLKEQGHTAETLWYLWLYKRTGVPRRAGLSYTWKSTCSQKTVLTVQHDLRI